MNFLNINKKYNLKAKRKYVYSIWLIAVIIFEVAIFILANIKKTPKLLKPIKDNWSWSVMIMFCAISIPLGFIWLYCHYQETLLNQIIGPEIFPAWHFVENSILFYVVRLGIFIADHIFLWSGMPFGLIFFWWLRVDDPKVKKPKYNTQLNFIFMSILYSYLCFMGLVWDFSAFITVIIYVFPFIILWFSELEHINFHRMIIFFLIMSIYVVLWEIVNSWAVGWVYGAEYQGHFIHSILFSTKDPLLYSSWQKPISIILNYGWAGMFFMVPVCSRLRRYCGS